MDTRQLKEWMWPAVLVAAVLGGLTFAFWPKSVAVDIARAERGPMTIAISDDGITRVREVYVLSAPIAGKLLRVETHAGDFITARKTIVATIEPADPAFLDVRSQRQLEFTVSAARAASDLALANVRGREAEKRLAARELERAQTLFAKGVVSKARVDTAEATLAALDASLATAKAALRQREFEIKTAQAALISPLDEGPEGKHSCCFQLRAPVDGQILRVLQENESYVQPGQPVAEVGDPADLEIVVDLVSSEAVKVAPDDKVLISHWGGDQPLEARVKRIEPSGQQKISALGIEERRVNIIIDLVSPREQWERLGHGYQVEASIIRWQGTDVLQVPVGAMFRKQEDWAVYKVVDGRARLAIVKAGHVNEATAEITDGLSAGDTVIVHPGELVADNVKIAPR